MDMTTHGFFLETRRGNPGGVICIIYEFSVAWILHRGKPLQLAVTEGSSLVFVPCMAMHLLALLKQDSILELTQFSLDFSDKR
jgi:hypothetical protein